MFDLLYPQFLWMAWNPTFDLFKLFWIFGPAAQNGKHKPSELPVKLKTVRKHSETLAALP